MTRLRRQPHCDLSSVFDASSGIERNKKFFKLVRWYVNEWDYGCHVGGLIKHMLKKGI